MREHRLVTAIRARSAAEALGAAKAIARGGLKLLEITFTVPDAVKVMESLASEPDVVVGAGTVLTAEQARAALGAGARFIIAPNLAREVAEVALMAGVFYCPGAYTTNEILAARDMGAHVIKLYPVGVAGGPQYVRVIRDPLPDVPLLAAGGTTLENMLPFLMAGCIGVGLGGALCDPALVAAGNWGELTMRSKNFAQRLAQAHTSGILAKVGA
ncbi:MAG TPA: bifunctional 4-hydroxy-2-oxoglutarate aldolase/2-dehydro-3-deoxy-phosphogluconate aldolase [Candidatus Eisenbacteria bacterium]|nr:bifunctional 4-hydroxy-2-oxoglutarate aldolase/2-dehydro-3-deoxy-phosphogluconate aldolase [Candidatus Eisenbacteria bacterium]